MGSQHDANEVRFRRSKHLVAYWDHATPRIRNYATGRDVRVPGHTCAVLNAYGAWRTAAEAAERCPGMAAAEMLRASEGLSDQGLLIRDDRETDPAEHRMDRLDAWNPAAGHFHSATRDVRFSSLAASREFQRLAAATEPWPGPRFVPRGGADVPLPRPDVDSPASRAFLDRRSWRRFSARPVPLHQLSSLLWLTGGVQQSILGGMGEFALKTSPSGGALHPVELYVLARNVGGLPAGFYHYSGVDHALRSMTTHAEPVPIDEYLPQQYWFEGSAAVVFMVAHYERSLWRYTYARAYRAPLVEAGHLAQTFCVRATEMGLAPFVSMALADSRIEREIDADGITRAVLYAAGIGARPDGCEWAPLPDGLGSLDVRLNVPGSSSPE